MERTIILRIRIKLFQFFIKSVDFIRQLEVFILGGEKCLRCGENSGIYPVCRNCVSNLFIYSPCSRCKTCGKILISEIENCSSCKNESILHNVDEAFPLHTYRLWKKNLLFAWKSEEKRVLSPLFAQMVFNQLRKISMGDDLLPVVPVPPRPGKIKKKGWDQIDELCFYLKNIYGVKVYKVLERLSKKQQKKLSRDERLQLIKKGYVLKNNKKIKSFLQNIPEKIVLIDDVMTTGSTIEACAEALKTAGVKTVVVITLFIVD